MALPAVFCDLKRLREVDNEYMKKKKKTTRVRDLHVDMVQRWSTANSLQFVNRLTICS